MRNVAGFTLTLASAFLAVVALMLDSAALFYMGTALVATIIACRIQSRLSVLGLRFERIAPASVRVGDLVTVEITVWSDKKLRRPLVEIQDNRPPKMLISDLTPSLPIAPAYDLPIQTQYQFRPQKRGRYRWSGLTVQGTDALGLYAYKAKYETTPAEITVLPRPIPVSVELPASAGWGISEAESGQTRGAGLEPRGVRQYVQGDSLRHVHWRSSAKTGQLLVKEFEAGTHSAAAFLIQDSAGSEVGTGAKTSLELICGHAVFLAETFVRMGAKVEFPGLDDAPSHGSSQERIQEIYEELAGVQATSQLSIAEKASALAGTFPPGSVLFAFIAVADDQMPDAIQRLAAKGTSVVALVYDASKFKNKGTVRSATDPMYLGQLRDSGATTVVMPLEGLDESAG